MPISELFGSAWRALRAHPMRSLLTTLGIVIAVWTVVSVLAVVFGMNDYVRTQVFSLSPDVFVVTRFGIITSSEEFFEAVKRKEISDDEVERLRDLCASCAEVGVSINGSRAIHNGNRRMPDTPLVGASANFAGLQGLDIEEGRYFSEFEDEGRQRVAVIGSEVREELFPNLDPIDRQLWIGGVPHKIIGLLTKQGNVLGQSQDLVVHVPYRSARKMLGRARGLDVQMNLLVRARGGVDAVEDCQQDVVQIFRWLRHVPFRSSDPIGIITAEMVQMVWRQISASMFVLVIMIAGVSLLVGAIVVANIMIVSVVERTREIGLRLALGARKRDILKQFLVEAIILSLLGGVLGASLGVGTAWLVDTYAPVPAEVGPGLITLAMSIAAMSGLLAGFFPALKASRLTPIDALRHE